MAKCKHVWLHDEAATITVTQGEYILKCAKCGERRLENG